MTEPNNGTRLVHVGCKLPNGFWLELFPEAEPQPCDLSKPAAFMPPPPGKRFLIKGANSLRNDLVIRGLAQPKFKYAVSVIPADVWDCWYRRNKNTNLVTGGFIFAMDSDKEARAAGKEREDEKTGLEPLNPTPELDERLRRTAAPGAPKVTAEPDRLAELNRKNDQPLAPWEKE